MNHLINRLKLLGLSTNEAVLYITLLKEESATAYLLAKNSGIKRPTVYITLDELRKKGLIIKVPHPKKQIFIAKNPNDFISEEYSKISKVKEILPNLFGLMRNSHEPFKTLLFDGSGYLEQGLYYKIEDIKDSEILCYYANTPQNIESRVQLVFDTYNRTLSQNNIRARAFAPDTKNLFRYREKDISANRNVKKIDTKLFPNEITIEVTKLFVRIIFHSDSKILIIESEKLVNTLTHIFNLLWISVQSE